MLAAVARISRVADPFRLTEHRLRHFDGVVEGERVNDDLGSIGDRCQPLRQLGARLGSGGVEEMHHHVVEQSDLVFGIMRCAVDEEIGDARQHLHAARVRAGGKRSLEFIEQGLGAHGLRTARH